MKKIISKLRNIITLFIIGAQNKSYASSKDTNSLLQSVADEKISSCLYGVKYPVKKVEHITSKTTIIVSIILFIIGLVVLLNKNIKKKTKVIIGIVLGIVFFILMGIYIISH